MHTDTHTHTHTYAHRYIMYKTQIHKAILLKGPLVHISTCFKFKATEYTANLQTGNRITESNAGNRR